MYKKSMYEKATAADFSIVGGVLLIVFSLFWKFFLFLEDMNFYLYFGAGVGLLALGFILDKIRERKKRRVDLEKLRPKVSSYIEEATELMTKGGKALEAEKYGKALSIYQAAKGSLELAEEVVRALKDSARLESVIKLLTEARRGVAHAKAGLAYELTKKAEKYYSSLKFEKAKEQYEKALALLRESEESLELDTEIAKVEENLRSCKKRIGEIEMNSLLKEVEERERIYKDYLGRDLLFDAREMLNEMEVKLQQASEIAETFSFTQAMETLNQTLGRVRLGKSRVEAAILEKLRVKKPSTGEITQFLDKIDPTLRKVAVDVADDVEVYSGYDFRNGAVRLQLTIVNNRNTVISEVNLRILKDERLLRLIEVNPDYPTHFNEVGLGTIPPGEKRMLNLYFDPQVCGEIKVDSTLTYLDSGGTYHSLVSERKVVEIPEPKIGKGENLNTSYLNGIVEQAKSRGRRIFLVPSNLETSRAFGIVKEVLEGRGLSLVWEKDTKGFSAGYHGLCDGDECALIITSDQEAIELYGASLGEHGVTTLLTSISGRLKNRLDREGHRGVSISLTIKDSVLNRTAITLGGDDPLILADSEKLKLMGEQDPGPNMPSCPRCGGITQYSEEEDDNYCWKCEKYVGNMADG